MPKITLTRDYALRGRDYFAGRHDIEDEEIYEALRAAEMDYRGQEEVPKEEMRTDDLPENFPLRDKFIKAGLDTLRKVNEASSEQLAGIKGSAQQKTAALAIAAEATKS